MDSTTRLRDLFEQALALPIAARAGFLAAHCPDLAQREQVERMLAADAADDDLLDAGDAAAAAQRIGADEPAPTLPPGSHIGPFELVEVLGEGGSSTVFRAFREVDGVRQEVALKLLRRGLYAPEAQHQFRREQRALAQLKHPGIARLIEGGITDNSLAYIALELVDGVPITDYANQHMLDLDQRLALFVQVCHAVQAAHRALIVHRDLKPSNVLVTAEGEVKLLDFGIAKLLEDDEQTQTIHAAFTPAYAAPEQHTGAAVTTATDVYALGVLLGELVTGQRVNDGCGRTPSARVANNKPPASTPRIHQRQLRGDINNIVMKAIDPEPDRRYASAGALADDVERMRSGQPVAAHPPSRTYRARKFVTRHRGGVIATTLFLIAIFATLGLALWQADVARQQAARANTVRDFLVSVFESASAELPRDQRPTPAQIVDIASTQLLADDTFPDAIRAELLLSLARVARSLGAHDSALKLIEHAEPVVDRVYAHDDPRWWRERTLHGAILADGDDSKAVFALLGPLRAGLLARHDNSGAIGLRVLGAALLHDGQVKDGLVLLDQARTKAQRWGTGSVAFDTAVVEAEALLDAGHFHAGLTRAQSAFAIWKQQGQHADARILNIHEAIALGAEAAGDIKRAETHYRAAIDLGQRFYDKPNPEQAWNVGMYGSFLIAQGRLQEAEPYAVQGLALRKQVFGNDDARTLYGLVEMGKLRYAQKRFAEAVTWYTQAATSCVRTHAHKLVCPRIFALRGLTHGNLHDFDAANRDFDTALKAQRDFGGDNNPNFAYVLELQLQVQYRQRDYAATLITADKVLKILASANSGMLQQKLQTRLVRAEALMGLRRNPEALTELLVIEPAYAKRFPTGSARYVMAAQKARALAAAKHSDEASVAARTALKLPHSAKSKFLPELQRLAESVRPSHK